MFFLSSPSGKKNPLFILQKTWNINSSVPLIFCPHMYLKLWSYYIIMIIIIINNSSTTNFFECLLIVPGNLLSVLIKSVRVLILTFIVLQIGKKYLNAIIQCQVCNNKYICSDSDWSKCVLRNHWGIDFFIWLFQVLVAAYGI